MRERERGGKRLLTKEHHSERDRQLVDGLPEDVLHHRPEAKKKYTFHFTE
jgi:hypothetical protein